MKVIILCGGKGLRMNGLKASVPKALAEVNGKPILWNIMNLYSRYGHKEFILPLGYKGEQIKEYLINYSWKQNNIKVNLQDSSYELLEKPVDWSIACIDTGRDTMTGARIKRVENYLESDDTFLLTYGDGLSDININKLLAFHKEKGKFVTVTGIKKNSQYGILKSENGLATEFIEKPKLNMTINGGFFVCNKEFFHYLSDDDGCVLEEEPLRNLIKDRQLAIYDHDGAWMSIDTPKDLEEANKVNWWVEE
jgi:glucose-1-phosphate cytidylyltransferase